MRLAKAGNKKGYRGIIEGKGKYKVLVAAWGMVLRCQPAVSSCASEPGLGS